MILSSIFYMSLSFSLFKILGIDVSQDDFILLFFQFGVIFFNGKCCKLYLGSVCNYIAFYEFRLFPLILSTLFNYVTLWFLKISLDAIFDYILNYFLTNLTPMKGSELA